MGVTQDKNCNNNSQLDKNMIVKINAFRKNGFYYLKFYQLFDALFSMGKKWKVVVI